jgi:hypothetical protein
MPLIYSGQEYGMENRLKFFEKDSIPKAKGKVWEQMKELGEIKKNNPALHGGKNAADYKRLATNDDSKIYAIERSKNGRSIYFIANLSSEIMPVEIKGINGKFLNLITDGQFEFPRDQQFKLAPYGYVLMEPRQ